MQDEDRRMPLGDRVWRSLRNWLSQWGLKRGCTRADVLNQLLSAGRECETAGVDPLQILQLAVAASATGRDPVRLLSASRRVSQA